MQIQKMLHDESILLSVYLLVDKALERLIVTTGKNVHLGSVQTDHSANPKYINAVCGLNGTFWKVEQFDWFS